MTSNVTNVKTSIADGNGNDPRERKTKSPNSNDNGSGGKRICIQDADGKIFFLQCPEGFAGGDNGESAVPLAAWVATTSRKRSRKYYLVAVVPINV